MPYSLTIDLSDDAYRALQATALASGTTPEDWVASLLDRQLAGALADPAEFERQYERYFGSVQSDDPDSACNARIDEDLTKAYGGDG